MNTQLLDSSIEQKLRVATRTRVSVEGDENYQRVSEKFNAAFLEILGIPTPAPKNCMFIFVENFGEDSVEDQGDNGEKGEIIAGLGLTMFKDIPKGKSFVEKCLDEKFFNDLNDPSGKRIERNKCGYIGSFFIHRKFKNKETLLALLLDELISLFGQLDLEYGLCFPSRIVSKRLDKFKIPYSRLAKIDHKNGSFDKFNYPEKYQNGLERWLKLQPELLLINKEIAKRKLGVFNLLNHKLCSLGFQSAN